MARRRAQAADVPQTDEAAITLITEYVSAERETLLDRVTAEAAIDAIKSRLANVVTAREAEQKRRFAALKAWWEAGGKEHAGKARSAELAGAKLGLRVSPPKVKFTKGYTAEKALIWLRGLRWSREKDFIRTKVELDKPAILKAIQAEESVKAKLGTAIYIDQPDEFFIDTGLEEDCIRKELAAS